MAMAEQTIRDISLSYGPELVLTVIRREGTHKRARVQEYRLRHEIDAVIKTIELLSEESSDFPQKLVATDEKHLGGYRKRRYVHMDRARLFPDRPDMIEEFSGEIKAAGLWLNKNLSGRQMARLIHEACEAAGVRCSFVVSFEP
jgi:hypothetical protein